MLDKVKLALRLTTDAFDEEIADMIDAALLDLGIAGVTNVTESDSLIIRAVITYCKIHFGSPDDVEWQRLKRSYDEQKAQLSTSINYAE